MRFDNSNDCMLSQLDILTVPDTQSSLEDVVWSIVQPNPDFERGTIIFNIFDLRKHRLRNNIIIKVIFWFNTMWSKFA